MMSFLIPLPQFLINVMSITEVLFALSTENHTSIIFYHDFMHFVSLSLEILYCISFLKQRTLAGDRERCGESLMTLGSWNFTEISRMIRV